MKRPAAARQRALDVKAEASLVAERVQRMLEQQQQQRADDDARHARGWPASRSSATGWPC